MPAGRPALGDAAKKVTISVRVTKAEAEELRRDFGTTSKALRALLSAHQQARSKRKETG
jgi:predicted RNA-binding protein YlqC (UPF0109 family)